MNSLEIYVDGSVTNNKDPNSDGGYGIVLLWENFRKEISGYIPAPCTNNVAEFLALKNSLNELKNINNVVNFYTDSNICVNNFLPDLSHRWKRNNLRLISIANEIDPIILKFKYTISHVKGHAGNKWNERADELAEMGRQKIITSKYFKTVNL